MLILASQSPRRAELLRQLDIPFTQISTDIDETQLCNEAPQDYVLRLAKQKSLTGLGLVSADSQVLGADTIVVIGQHILGKPIDQADSKRMLSLLSGQEHQVFTAAAISTEREGKLVQHSVLVKTDVRFCKLSEQKMQWYWQSGEPQDKAGSYAIQGLGGQFVTHISGSYSAVVGLPLFETHQLLEQFTKISTEN